MQQFTQLFSKRKRQAGCFRRRHQSFSASGFSFFFYPFATRRPLRVHRLYPVSRQCCWRLKRSSLYRCTSQRRQLCCFPDLYFSGAMVGCPRVSSRSYTIGTWSRGRRNKQKMKKWKEKKKQDRTNSRAKGQGQAPIYLIRAFHSISTSLPSPPRFRHFRPRMLAAGNAPAD